MTNTGDENIMPLPTISITFDEWPDASNAAFVIMTAAGLAGTYFVTPTMIDTPGGPTLNTLLAMKEQGWEIGVYSSLNMVNLRNVSRIDASNKLKALKDAMWAKGLQVRTLAAAQRAWNAPLARLAGCFDFVRVADQMRADVGHWGQFPITNKRYVRGGATTSLDEGDTAASLIAQVDDLIALGGYWNVVVHKIGSGGYSVNAAAFTALCQKVANEVALGTMRCLTQEQLYSE